MLGSPNLAQAFLRGQRGMSDLVLRIKPHVYTDLGPTQAVKRYAHIPLGARIEKRQRLPLLDPLVEGLELPT